MNFRFGVRDIFYCKVRFPKKVGQFNSSGYNPNKEYNYEKVQELHRRIQKRSCRT